jgi:pimeloyl-ACP methyl ester carboxylesterase
MTGLGPGRRSAMFDAILGLLDELGLDRPHLAGNSLGGRLSLDAGVAGRGVGDGALARRVLPRPRRHRLRPFGIPGHAGRGAAQLVADVLLNGTA